MRYLRSKGFTILELIIVFVVLSILAALAVTPLTSVISKSYDAAAETELSAVARQAWYLGASSSPQQYTITNLLNGAAGVSPNTVSTDPAGTNQLYLVSGASNTHLQVSVGLTGNITGSGLSLGGDSVNLAMMDQAYHCVYETYTQGVLTSTEVDPSPQYVASDGSTVNSTGNLCQASGSSISPAPSLTFTISGTASDAAVNLSIVGGTLANATSYTLSCPQYSSSTTPDTYGTLTAVTTGTSTPEPSSAISDPSPSTSSGVWTPSQLFPQGTAVTFTVSGLENNIVAQCSITALISSTPVTSNVVNLIPSSSLTPITPPINLPPPACNTATNCAITAPKEITPTGDPGPPVTPPTLNNNNLVGLSGLTSVASTDPQFNHYPFIANGSDGSITQVSVYGNAGSTAPYNEIPTGGYGREMFPPGTFCTLDTSTNLCANPQPNGLAPQPITLLNGYYYGSVTSSGPTPLIENSFYILDGNNNSIYRIDPNSYLVNSPQGYVPPTKTLIATLPSTPTGLAGFTCFTSSNTLLPATSTTSPLCLYTSTSSGVYSIQINPSYGSSTPVQIPGIPGGANSITYADYSTTPALAITYPSSSSSVYEGDIAYFQPGSGTYLGSVAAGNPSAGTSLALIGANDPLFGNKGGGSGLAFVNNTNQTIDVASSASGSSVVSVLAGGGTTPPTTSGVACASAQFGSIGALHQHGPLGTLFVTDSHPTNGATSALDEIVQNAGGSCEVYLVWGTLSSNPISNYQYATLGSAISSSTNSIASPFTTTIGGNTYGYYYASGSSSNQIVSVASLPFGQIITEPSGNKYQVLNGIPYGSASYFGAGPYLIAGWSTSSVSYGLNIYLANPYSSSLSPIKTFNIDAPSLNGAAYDATNNTLYIGYDAQHILSYNISTGSSFTFQPSTPTEQSSGIYPDANGYVISNGTLYEAMSNNTIQATALPVTSATPNYTTIASIPGGIQGSPAGSDYASLAVVGDNLYYVGLRAYNSGNNLGSHGIGVINLSNGAVNENFMPFLNGNASFAAGTSTDGLLNLLANGQILAGNSLLSGAGGTEYSFTTPPSYTATGQMTIGANLNSLIYSDGNTSLTNTNVINGRQNFYPAGGGIYLTSPGSNPVVPNITTDPFSPGSPIMGIFPSPSNPADGYVVDPLGNIYSIDIESGTYLGLVAQVSSLANSTSGNPPAPPAMCVAGNSSNAYIAFQYFGGPIYVASLNSNNTGTSSVIASNSYSLLSCDANYVDTYQSTISSNGAPIYTYTNFAS